MKRSKQSENTTAPLDDAALDAATGGFGFCEVTGAVVGAGVSTLGGGPVVGAIADWGVTGACNWAKDDIGSGGKPGDTYIPASYDPDSGTITQAWFFEPGMTP